MEESIVLFWETYCRRHEKEQPLPQVVQFGIEPAEQDRLVQWMLTGRKTATSSAVFLYEVAEERGPQIGDRSIVVNAAEQPVAVIETVQVSVVTWDQITTDLARQEGYPDLSTWKAAYQDLFAVELAMVGACIEDSLTLYFEEFQVVWHEKKDNS